MARAILLAEDSEDDELLFKLVMKQGRVNNPVTVVRDGKEAIAYMEGKGKFADRAAHPDPGVLFLDLKMPGLDGFAVLEWLKQQPGIREKLLIVVLSEMGDVNQIRRAYDLGAHSFLAKPLSKADLENLIEHFNGRWARSIAPDRP